MRPVWGTMNFTASGSLSQEWVPGSSVGDELTLASREWHVIASGWHPLCDPPTDKCSTYVLRNLCQKVSDASDCGDYHLHDTLQRKRLFRCLRHHLLWLITEVKAPAVIF